MTAQLAGATRDFMGFEVVRSWVDPMEHRKYLNLSTVGVFKLEVKLGDPHQPWVRRLVTDVY